MPKFNFSEIIAKNTESLESTEHCLGKGLIQNFTGTVSGARKILFGVQRDHVFPLINPEKAIVETGYEIRFGDLSSSIVKASTDYIVVAKISKFSFAPNHHYWLILKDIHTNTLEIVERISYHYITESFGYLNNNEYLDNLAVGDQIKTDEVVRKSLAYDEYNNRRDGCNFNVAYLALDDNMEDSVVMSDVAASRLTSPLIKPVEIMINDNDIPLNIYGTDEIYKIIPDIGEEIIDANLIALKKEKKDEAYYTQSVNRLRTISMSDDKKQVIGRVIDINIFCNNPAILDSYYYSQLKMYYNELKRQSLEFVQTITPYVSAGYTLSYQLQKLFANSKRIMNNDQYIDKRNFSNIILEIDVLEELPIEPGDKLANRYGGKGVVSEIWPQKFMPRFKKANGEYEYVDYIFNSSTMINRMNPGQNFETSLNHCGSEIVDHIIANKLNIEEAYDLIYRFIAKCSQEQADYIDEKFQNMNKEEQAFYMESIINSGCIQLSIRPLSETMTIDKLREIYKEFPFIKQNNIEVAMVGSDGNIRYIPARRPMVIGKQYIYRLKQYSHEKFSSCSLSATNIRNENTKSRVKKDHRELHSNTPVRIGNMEVNNLMHMGSEVVIANMMIHSISPQGRRLVEQMYTGDPFHVDVKLDSDSKNRSAEIANTYLKTIGRRLVFKKKLKKVKKLVITPIIFDQDPVIRPLIPIPQGVKDFDVEKAYKERQELARRKEEEGAIPVFEFLGVNTERWDEIMNKDDSED